MAFKPDEEYISQLLAALDSGEYCHAGLSARRDAELERQSNRTKSVFLANVSHEMRTPLNAILGYTELLLTGGALPQSVRSDVERIRDSGSTLLEIVNNILDLSKVESGSFTVRSDVYELRRLLEELSSSTLSHIRDKEISFSLQCGEALPEYLFGDAILIKQVAMNLLSNAAKYTKQGFITLTASYADGWLSLSVQDSGIGIKESDIPNIFKKFERLESNIDHSIVGTGLGLPLAAELAAQMGGRIDVRSESGIGSTFTFSLPQPLAQGSASGAAEELEVSAEGLSVLLVDDNAVNLTVAKRLLERFSLSVDCAEGGEDCLEKFGEKAYDLVLLDHMMPETDGVETLRRLRLLPRGSDQLVIALTANAMKGMREFFLDKGFNDYMAKPVSLADLRLMLEKWFPNSLTLREKAADSGERGAELLSHCRGIDIAAAMEYAGSYSTLAATVLSFAELIAPKSALIESCCDRGDLTAYTIEVHALKSSARLIGALTLSEMAAQLEALGREKKLQEIRRLTPALLDKYRSYDEFLSPLTSAEKHDAEKEAIEPAQLKKELSQLREYLCDFDLDSAEQSAERLCGCALSEPLEEKLGEVRSAVKMIDYMGATALVDQALELL